MVAMDTPRCKAHSSGVMPRTSSSATAFSAGLTLNSSIKALQVRNGSGIITQATPARRAAGITRIGFG